MRGSLSLLVAGGACALIAWAFWHYLGSDASGALATIMLVVVAVDNARLRRKLRDSPPLKP